MKGISSQSLKVESEDSHKIGPDGQRTAYVGSCRAGQVSVVDIIGIVGSSFARVKKMVN